MSSKAAMLRRSKFHNGFYTGTNKENSVHNAPKNSAGQQELVHKRGQKIFMTFWMDFEGQYLFDQYIDMSYLSDEFGDANFYLVYADSKYDAARQFVIGKYNDLVRRNKRSEIQNMCLEYIFEELSEGEHVRVEGKIGHLISAIENLMEAFDISDASSEDMSGLGDFFRQRNIAELLTPEVELELFSKANIMNVGVLELREFPS